MDIKEESCDLDFCSENEGDTKDAVKKVKIETVTSSSYIKPEVEDSTCLENEEHHLMRFNETIKESEIETKIDITEENWWLKSEDSCIIDGIKGDAKDAVKKVKIKTVTSSSYIKPEVEDSTCLENEEHHLMRFNETIKESEIETKIDITEENWWLKSEDSYIIDGIKNETHEDFCSTKLPSFYKQDVSSYTSHLCSSEAVANDVSFNMNKDALECESDRKCKSQKSLVTDTSLQHLKTQKLNHKGIKAHRCDICNKAFSYLSDVKKHKLSHEDIKSHQCDICNKAFKRSCNLKRHKLIHEGVKPHKCDSCNKAFTQLSGLIKHIMCHHDVKQHKCSICDKAFVHLSDLKRHKLIHEGIKPHTSSICTKASGYVLNSKKHKLVHEGIKLHICNICNKAFAQSSDLKTHKLIHDGIKPHKCNICNKAFTLLSHLKKHKMIHEGIKPHKCDICNKAFTDLSNMKTHKLIHKDK